MALVSSYRLATALLNCSPSIGGADRGNGAVQLAVEIRIFAGRAGHALDQPPGALDKAGGAFDAALRPFEVALGRRIRTA